MKTVDPWQVNPHTVMPVQFHGTPGMSREKWLMLAVLDDALEIYRKHGHASDPKHRRVVAETRRWLFSDDTSWPFSFVNVCHLLGIDVDWLRTQLHHADRAAVSAKTASEKLPLAS